METWSGFELCAWYEAEKGDADGALLRPPPLVVKGPEMTAVAILSLLFPLPVIRFDFRSSLSMNGEKEKECQCCCQCYNSIVSVDSERRREDGFRGKCCT